MKRRISLTVLFFLAISILFGIAAISSIFAYFPNLITLPLLARLGAMVAIFLCTGLSSYLVFTHAQGWLRHLDVMVLLITMLLSIGLGIIIRDNLAFFSPPLSRINIDRLIIQSSGQANRNSQGSQVAIESVQVNGVRIPWTDFVKTGVWEENQGLLSTHTSSRLRYQFSDFPPLQREMVSIHLRTGPHSGRVIVTAFAEQKIDLYRPSPGTHTLEFSFYTGSVWPVSDKILLSVLVFLGLSFYLAKISQKTAPVDSKVESYGIPDIFIAFALAVLMAGICFYMARRGSSLGFVDLPHDGYQLCSALDLKRGGVIFRDTFSQYGPFPDYLNALALEIFGERLLSLKFMAGFVFGLIIFCQYFLSRTFLARFPAGVTGLALIMIGPAWIHGVMVSPHLYATLLQIIGLFFIVRYIQTAQLTWLVGGGIFTGIMWGMKQNVGTYHFIALVVFVIVFDLTRPTAAVLGRGRLRKCFLDLCALTAGFTAVIAATLIWLAANHALTDWYQQTILLPPAYVFSSQSANSPAGYGLFFVTSFLSERISPFITLSFSYIIGVFRLAILGCGAWQLYKRREANPTIVLLAIVTFFAWFGMIPSGVISHQWWSIAAGFGVVGWLLWKLLSPIPVRIKPVFFFLIFSLAIYQTVNLNITSPLKRSREGQWDEELKTPPVLAGIRTNAAFASFLETIGKDVNDYLAQNPQKRLLVIGSVSGEGNLFQAFSGACAAFHPAYWNVEGVIARIYPDYYQRRDAYVRAEKPLILVIDPSADNPPNLSALGLDYALIKEYSQDNGYQTLGDYRKFSLYTPNR